MDTIPHSGPAPTHVEVKHDVTGGVWDCPIPYLDTAAQNGWHPITAPEDTPYDDFDRKDLEAEIDRRNAELEATPVEGVEALSKAGNKPDLIVTLLADDSRRGNPA